MHADWAICQKKGKVLIVWSCEIQKDSAEIWQCHSHAPKFSKGVHSVEPNSLTGRCAKLIFLPKSWPEPVNQPSESEDLTMNRETEVPPRGSNFQNVGGRLLKDAFHIAALPKWPGWCNRAVSHIWAIPGHSSQRNDLVAQFFHFANGI